ncbi:helicase [Mycobacteroides abscessus subsp. abscessus]|nr:helicase [Mycobacteroides abscessus subsp. abscessus]
MLSQHLITAPVFDALFGGSGFAASNPVSIGMQAMLDVLEGQGLEAETEHLERFYESVRRRAAGVTDAAQAGRIPGCGLHPGRGGRLHAAGCR